MAFAEPSGSGSVRGARLHGNCEPSGAEGSCHGQDYFSLLIFRPPRTIRAKGCLDAPRATWFNARRVGPPSVTSGALARPKMWLTIACEHSNGQAFARGCKRSESKSGETGCRARTVAAADGAEGA